MKRFYSKFRIGLMTFALGLASVFISNGSLQFSDEVTVDLPKAEYGEVQIVFPRSVVETPYGGGAGGHLYADYAPNTRTKLQKNNDRLPNE